MTIRPYKIHAIKFVKTVRSVRRMDHYTFNPRKRAHWLQHLCLRVLEWLGCGAYEDIVTVERILIDPDKFMKKLFEQHSALLELNREPRTLLIGGDNYDELMGEITSTGFDFGFHAEYMHSRTVMGLRVQVVPWMRGMIVLPWGLTGSE